MTNSIDLKMTLEQLAKEVSNLREEAKQLFPTVKRVVYAQHYIPARGYPGSKIPPEEQKRNAQLYEDERYSLPEAMFSCVNCKLPWNKCFDKECKIAFYIDEPTYQFHLQKMISSDDPEEYLKENKLCQTQST